MLVFVDDFNAAGPEDTVKRCWERLAKHVEMSGPQSTGKFLGRNHRWGKAMLDGHIVRATSTR